jgi:hypothetical protein
LTLYKFPLNTINENTEIKKGLIDIFNNITNKLCDSSFEGKTDSKYVKDKKLVLPFLPHVYYNIIDELYKKIAQAFFILFDLMLEKTSENFLVECFSISIGYFQLIIHCFDPIVRKK